VTRRWLLVLAVPAAALAAGTALTAGAAPAVKTQECKGLRVCVRVAGSWVVVPAGLGVPRRPVQYDLQCPRGYVVGGLDAEVSDRAVDVTFQAKLGSPVNPGITTSRDAVFTALYVGSARRAPTFRPHIGCMPASGGGGRIQTAVTFRAGAPTVRRIVNARLGPGVTLVSAACTRRQRLVSWFTSTAFNGKTPPTAATIGAVRVTHPVRSGRVVAVPHVADAALGARPIVQVVAVCAVVP
jgi:hypothetical protein